MEHHPAFCHQYTPSSGSHRRDSELLEDYLNEQSQPVKVGFVDDTPLVSWGIVTT